VIENISKGATHHVYLARFTSALQQEFSNTKQGQKRKVWFAYIARVVVPFTSSMTSNLLRALQTLFGLDIQSQRFYTFTDLVNFQNYFWTFGSNEKYHANIKLYKFNKLIGWYVFCFMSNFNQIR
jgi:hypothetical protein